MGHKKRSSRMPVNRITYDFIAAVYGKTFAETFFVQVSPVTW
ncbi:hypothetical protein Salmuc_01034 [Salipiger mucosus DSM 16094]|uniref:Uncharacterized protein n=1 Tax=Salipiger mucosus DSM 16094 TaxID=1123237 RepID=S9QUV4_9RHOB|nr:hypothetical protein Salmuc_01034 [Salipiger mucosus DSM 16094]